MSKSGKGCQFERDMARKLSLWWSGDNPNIFWRTSNSGGRATVHAKKGKAIKNQNGDLCAIDPIGVPFIEQILIEIKRGYQSTSIQDFLDKSEKKQKSMMLIEQWIDKAIRNNLAAGTFSWFLILKRNARETLCLFPVYLARELDRHGEIVTMKPLAELSIKIGRWDVSFFCCRLDDFLDNITPDDIRKLAPKDKKELYFKGRKGKK